MSRVNEVDIDGAVQETVEHLEPIIDEEAPDNEFEAKLCDAVEESLRHTADLVGIALHRNWVDWDDDRRWVVIDASDELVRTTTHVLNDAGFESDEAGLVAEYVHRVYARVGEREVDGYVMVVPVPEPLRDVYW